MSNSNNLIELNWSAFLIIIATIALIRFSVRKLLPITLLSITTSVTVGFIVFLGFGVLGYSKTIFLPVDKFSLLIILAYMSFLLGAITVKTLSDKKFPTNTLLYPSRNTARIALIFVVFYSIFSFTQFMQEGGIPRAIDMFLGGYAHREYLIELETLQDQYNGGIGIFLTNIMQNIFLCFWVIGFCKYPRYSIILYGFSILPIFTGYASRSYILGQLLVPLLAYYTFFRPSRKVVTTQLAIFTTVVLIFFSWYSAVRLGMTHDTSIDKLISDTLRDGGNSVEPATAILTQNWRGNSLEYLISLIGFLIPRSLWPDKPLIMYNFEITYLYTGNWPKPGNSIVTSTILGEAWYYFGVTGTFTLLVVFGAYAQLIEVMLSRTVWTLGIYYSTIYLSFILVRSTFLTYYQNGISALVAAGIVTLLCLWNLQQQNQRIHRTWSKSMQIGSTTCVKSSILQP